MPNINVVKKEILIGSTTKLGNGFSGVLTIKNLSCSSELPAITTKVFSIPQMVFINSLTTTHVNRTTN